MIVLPGTIPRTGRPRRQFDVSRALGVGETPATTGSGDEQAWWGIPDRAERGRGGRPIKQTLDDLIAPRVIGREAGEIEKLWFELWDFGYRYGDQGIYLMALSGFDLALWDLLGRRLRAPVVQLLGGAAHDGLPAYASLPPLRDVEVALSETARAIEAGLTAVKLHELSIDYVEALRDCFGCDLRIMVDVNGHFDPIEAIALGRRLAAHDIVWYEEPVRPMRDHVALKRVRDACGVDLAAGENEYTLADFDRLLACGALSYVQPEITKIGGLTPAKRISALTGDCRRRRRAGWRCRGWPRASASRPLCRCRATAACSRLRVTVSASAEQSAQVARARGPSSCLRGTAGRSF